MAEETQTTESTENERPLSLLAKEQFGTNYYGDVPEDPKETEPEEPEEEPEEDPEEEPEPGEEPSEEEPGEDPEEEDETIQSWDELVQHQEWDPEWAESLSVPVKVDGEESSVPLKDLKDSYQKNQAADKRLEEAKQKRDQLSQEVQQKAESLNSEFATAANLIKEAENLLDQDSGKVDWDRLRHDDPAEYSAKKAEINDRRQEIERMKERARESYQQSVQQHQNETQEQAQARLQREAEALVEAVPEWKDQEKAQQEKAQIVSYLKSLDFGDEEISAATDHRIVLMARKAMMHDQGQKKVDTAKKKVAKVPKTVKPGASQPADKGKKEKVRKLEAKFKRTGKLDDAYALQQAKKQAQ